MRSPGRVLLVVLLLAGVGAMAYLLGRASVDPRPVRVTSGGYTEGYRAGRQAAFSGFDGGWSYGEPYIVSLSRGGPGVTYRVARRWPMLPGETYRRCGGWICGPLNAGP
jgi:hypothetical protein